MLMLAFTVACIGCRPSADLQNRLDVRFRLVRAQAEMWVHVCSEQSVACCLMHNKQLQEEEFCLQLNMFCTRTLMQPSKHSLVKGCQFWGVIWQTNSAPRVKRNSYSTLMWGKGWRFSKGAKSNTIQHYGNYNLLFELQYGSHSQLILVQTPAIVNCLCGHIAMAGTSKPSAHNFTAHCSLPVSIKQEALVHALHCSNSHEQAQSENLKALICSGCQA